MLDLAAACVTNGNGGGTHHGPDDAFAVAGDATWGMRFAARYLRGLDRRRRWIIGIWFVLGVAARRSSAEHLIAMKSLRCTATAWMLIVAECSAIP